MAGKSLPRRRASRCHVAVIAGVSLVAGIRAASASIVVDFEDLSLPAESFYNGSDGVGGFTSGGAFFNNAYTDYGGGVVAWSGWSYSNVTDNTTPGFGNQYSAVTGGGAEGSNNYGVAFAFEPGDATIGLPASTVPESILVTNTTYTYFSMRDGDPFTDRFGGPTGDETDYLLLTITGLDPDREPVGSVGLYLADYRFEDNTRDYIVDTWTEVELSSLYGATMLSFGLESSDVGPFGMNTPAYFAVDNLHLVPEPTVPVLMAVGAIAVLRRRLGD